MKKIFALPLAAMMLAACSDPTANANNTEDLAVSYGKKPGPSTGSEATGTAYIDTYNFNAPVVTAAANSSIGTDTYDGTSASSATNTEVVPADNTNRFIGRFNNVATRALVVLTGAGSLYTVNFDLYIIGSWDGKGKQAQHGVFLPNIFQVGYRCTSLGAVTPLFTTTFSNQLTVQQDFPLAYNLGGFKATTDAVNVDNLGYRSRPDLSHTPTFRSFADATYNLTYTIDSSACGVGNPPTFVFSSTAPGQQNNYDESWGLDNITIKVDS